MWQIMEINLPILGITYFVVCQTTYLTFNVFIIMELDRKITKESPYPSVTMYVNFPNPSYICWVLRK